jgi:hypothetical protein
MASAVENLRVELLTRALLETGNADKIEEINQQLLDYLTKGKIVSKE